MDKTYKIKHPRVSVTYASMLADQSRNQFFYEALSKTAKDKVVLDLGTGTGILSHYALAAGAKFVYAVDVDFEISMVATKILLHNFASSDFKVIHDSFWSESCYKKIDRQVDLVVTETFGPGLFDEGIFQTWYLLRKYLGSKQIVSIPDRVSVDIWTFDNADDVTLFDHNYKEDSKDLSPDHVIQNDFFESFVKVDNEFSAQYFKARSHTARWAQVQNTPDRVLENVFSYSYTDLPDISQDDDGKFKAHISTELDIPKPCTIALINKVQHLNTTLYLNKSHWKFCPCFVIHKPGKYRLTFENTDLQTVNNSMKWSLTLLTD
jgi:predicted RNA methylase